MTRSQRVGRFTEDLIADYLKSVGYDILKQNFRSKFFEIDIIARDQNELVLVEVKFRSNFLGEARDLLPKDRIKKLLMASKVLVKYWPNLRNIRVDLIIVLLGHIPKHDLKIKHFKDVISDDHMI